MNRRQWLAPMTVLVVALVAGVVATMLVRSARRDTSPGRETRPTGKAASETSAPAGEPSGVPYGKTKPAIGECADARPYGTIAVTDFNKGASDGAGGTGPNRW